MSGGALGRLRAALGRTSDARLALAVGLAAFVVRLAYVLEIEGTEWGRVLVGDATAYDAWARAIAAGDWVGHEVFYQAPLYPYVLAVIYKVAGPSPLAVRVVQAALGGASCGLLVAAGRRFFSRGVGLAAGLVLAFYGPAIFFAGLVHKMALDLFFTTVLLDAVGRVEREVEATACPRPRSLLFAGLALGCLALTRENALAWLPVLAVWLGWRLRAHAATAARSVGWLVVGSLFVLGPVAVRNFALGGGLLPTTSQAGVNFYLGNNAEADGVYTPLRFGHGSFAQEREDAIELAQQAEGRALSPSEVSRYWSGRAWSWISAHPGAWVRLLARKWLLVWGAREIPDSDEPIVYRDASIVLRATWWLSFGVLAPVALMGMVASLADRRVRRRAGLLVALLLASAASTAAFLVFGRYRVPMIPIVALFAVVGAARLAPLARERPPRVREAAAALALMALAAVASRFPRVEEGHPRATADYNLGVTLEAAGELAPAEAAYRAAVADNPAFTEARVNLGAMLARAGDLAGAVRQETAALAVKPDDPTAHTDLANALMQEDRLDEAEAHYEAALRADPGFSPARAGLEILRDLRRNAAPR
jgi:4-amino-4-deoxy-L-arabinose transferase-like glycosyltransferase